MLSRDVTRKQQKTVWITMRRGKDEDERPKEEPQEEAQPEEKSQKGEESKLMSE